MKARPGAWLLAWLAVGALSLANNSAEAQCSVADCPAGYNIDDTPPYTGTNGNDCFIGTPDADIMDGKNSDDFLCGGGGNDVCLNATITDGSCESLTHAALGSFGAFEDRGSLVARWVTTSETNTVGFYLYAEQDGEWVALHDGILPALLSAPQGGTYDFRDEHGAPGELRRYLLVEVDARGAQSSHGPFEASADKQSAGAPIALYFGVEQTGLYAVAAAEIAARFDLDEPDVRDRIEAGELSLTEGGEPVAWRAAPDGSALEFFGVERKSLYTTERIYRLSLETGVTMTERSAAPDAITDGLTYEAELHLEADEVPGVLVAQDPDEDYWFWQLIVPEAALNDGQNTLTVEPSAPSNSALYLNFADLLYTRFYDTSAASLLFNASEDASLEVAGLTNAGTELFDVTDLRNPVHLIDTVGGPTGLQLAAEPGREYYALAPEERRAPTSVWNDVPSDLRSRANAADYLIIAPAELIAAAQEVADYRESDGLQPMLVELQDVYDEYAHGTPDPNAIRAFLADAHERWETAPDFVTLIGKGSLDYRDLWGAGGNLFPPLMTLTRGGILSSDTKYADFLGDDGMPDLSIGRLPVKSASELQAVIEQIIEYEASIDSLPNEVAFLADATDSQSDFAAWADATTEDLPNDWSVSPIYRSELPDLETMTIDGNQPVFASMTCVSSRFAAPGFTSLGEAMLIDEEGAIAVWGPSGLSINEQASPLLGELLSAISAPSETRIGPIIDSSLGALTGSEHAREMMAIYHLFGDPALRVAKARDPDGTGGSSGSGGTPGGGAGGGGGARSVVMAGCAVRPMDGNSLSALLCMITLALVLRRRRRT